SLSKALKGMRVYDQNNKMLVRFLEKAGEDLKALHAVAEDISFSIREDRILYASTIGGVVKVEGVEVAEDRCRADEIITQLARKLNPLRQAYERALEKEQTLGGEILISFVILEGRAKNLEL